MTVLMTKRKYDAIRSIERDRGMLSDQAADDRYASATPEEGRMSESERVRFDKFRQKIGK